MFIVPSGFVWKLIGPSAYGLKNKFFLETALEFLTDTDPTRKAMGLHPAGSIDGISPDIVSEAGLTDHPCDQGPGMQPNPELQDRKPLLKWTIQEVGL